MTNVVFQDRLFIFFIFFYFPVRLFVLPCNTESLWLCLVSFVCYQDREDYIRRHQSVNESGPKAHQPSCVGNQLFFHSMTLSLSLPVSLCLPLFLFPSTLFHYWCSLLLLHAMLRLLLLAAVGLMPCRGYQPNLFYRATRWISMGELSGRDKRHGAARRAALLGPDHECCILHWGRHYIPATSTYRRSAIYCTKLVES